MPLIRKVTLEHSTLALWETVETVAELSAMCTPDETGYALAALNGESRRREWLAWHALLHALAPGAEPIYLPSGSPSLRDGRHIGVSHTQGYAAVIVGMQPCAVDIEPEGRDFGRAAPRYLTACERELIALHGQRYAGVIWCAKEALYKWTGRTGLDFRRDILIDGIRPDDAAPLDGRVCGHSVPLYDLSDDRLLVVCCEGDRPPVLGETGERLRDRCC